jgi:hypothetical protein
VKFAGSELRLQTKVDILHWILLDSFDTLDKADEYIHNKYKGRISNSGADRVDIVDRSGSVIRRYSVC